MTDRYEVSELATVGRLNNRNFIRVIVYLQTKGIDIRAERISASLLEIDYKIRFCGTRHEAARVDAVFAEMNRQLAP